MEERKQLGIPVMRRLREELECLSAEFGIQRINYIA
jgi:hypothetical protein